MELTPEELQALVEQANIQGSGTPEVKEPVVQTVQIKEGEIIPPKEPEYKSPEELRDEALRIAEEDERARHIISLEAKLIEDLSLTPEQRAEIEAELLALKPKEEEDDNENKPETAEEKIARLEKELEEAKLGKKDENPLAEVEKKVQEAGIDIPEFYKEYVENGELSPESLKALLDAGFNKTAVDAYIATKIAQGEKETETIISQTVGTREVYGKMAEWMRANLTVDEIKQYDAGVNTPHAKIYIENMYAKYTKATTVPVVIRNNGESSRPNQQVGFKSQNEQAMAIADPRYGSDAKYTDSVRKRIQLSTF